LARRRCTLRAGGRVQLKPKEKRDGEPSYIRVDGQTGASRPGHAGPG
jgi:hypothetical protein